MSGPGLGRGAVKATMPVPSELTWESPRPSVRPLEAKGLRELWSMWPLKHMHLASLEHHSMLVPGHHALQGYTGVNFVATWLPGGW